MLNKLIVALMIGSFSSTAFSSSRVDEAINETTDEQITKIVELEKSLIQGKKELTKIEAQLVIAQRDSEDRKSYISFRNKAAILAVASAVSIASSYVLQEKRMEAFKKSGKLFTAPGENETALAILGLVGFPISALAAGAGEVGVLLTKDEVKEVSENVKSLKDSLNKKNLELKREAKILCKADPRHEVCYFDVTAISDK